MYNNIQPKRTNLHNIPSSIYQLSPWLDEKPLKNEEDMHKQIKLISQRYQHNKKWILIISDNVRVMNKVSVFNNNIKVLWVHSDKVNVKQNAIENTLLKGNCSAVIFCNASFTNEQVACISQCAAKGKTHCVLLNEVNRLH